MKYYLTARGIGKVPEIEIDKVKFQKLKASKIILSAVLNVEEKFEILIANYLELEKETLNLTAEYMVRFEVGYVDISDGLLLLNRRVVNLLTSTRLYIDQSKQHVKECVSKHESVKEIVNSYFSQEYEDSFEFRFMEALRNYVQHQGLAIHTYTRGINRDDKEEDDLREIYLRLFSHKNVFENDKGFNKKVLNEMPDKVDLMLAVRKYVNSIYRIHEKIRELITENVNSAREVINEAASAYQKIKKEDTVGLYAVCKNEEEQVDDGMEKFPIFLDWDDIRIKLAKRNRGMGNLDKRYVTGKIKK